MIRLLAGDARDVLPTLAAESVQCVVTSPPYYGLRDYGTALWDGGDAACDHRGGVRQSASSTLAGTGHGNGKPLSPYLQSLAVPYRDTCGKCGAVRVDRQIGLEATPDEYLATMVGVFREVRRVLRRDGTVFMNLGDSYASGEMSPSRSRRPLHVLACDSGDIEPAGSAALGSDCPDLCGECRGSLLSHSVHRIDLLEAVLRRENADGHQPCDVPRVAPVSTMRRSSQQPQASNSVASSRGARCLLCGRSLADDALASARTVECKPGSGWNGSASRNQDTDVSGWALPGHTTASHRYKPKDLLLMPARLALALQADGWWVRSDVIWCKPNPMPESAKDRPTSAHEHIFLLTKSAKYFYDAQAIAEAVQDVRQGSATRSVLPTQERDNGQQLSTMRSATQHSIPGNGQGAGKSAGSEYLAGGQGEDSPLFRFTEREGGDHASPCCEASAEEGRDLYSDPSRMARDQGECREQVPLLRQEDGSACDGSCDPTEQGRASRSVEHRSSMQELQQQERHATPNAAVRNARNWWVIATHAYSAAHFATFPPELAERCIKAGTSERGCCTACGKPWARVTSRDAAQPDVMPSELDRFGTGNAGVHRKIGSVYQDWLNANPSTTIGWSAGCKCAGSAETVAARNARTVPAGEKPAYATVPCTVLDPFAGAGTTLLVADRLQRDAVGIELNTAYTEMAMERCRQDAPLFTSFPPAEDPEDMRMGDLFAGDEYQQAPLVEAKRDAFRNSGRYVNQGLSPSNGLPEAAE